jgi:phosphoribosylaminoimidazole-succinocarboxamide synthase
MYGVDFPDEMRKNQKLPATIITPTTKAAHGEHDKPITPSEVVDRGLLTQEHWDALAETALALFARGREIAARNSLILVDTKYEFGLDEAGRITLADEIHTPDSSRYWKTGSYEQRFAAGADPESLDKDFLRLWIAERCDPYNETIPEIPTETLIEFSQRYITLCETVTGQEFRPPDQAVPVRERIHAALQRYV